MKMELGLPSYQAGGQQYPAGAPNGIPAIPFPAEDFHMENPPVLKSNKMRPSNKISDSAGRIYPRMGVGGNSHQLDVFLRKDQTGISFGEGSSGIYT